LITQDNCSIKLHDNSQKTKPIKVYKVVYTSWNLWKERNQRIFNNAQESALQVAARVKEDIEQWRRASERGG